MERQADIGSNQPAVVSDVDLVEWASSGLLAASFPSSRAAGYLPAVNVARQALHYGELQIGKQSLHLAGFGRSRQQAALALIVVRYLRGAKGVQLYAGGSLIIEWSRAESVLHCYLESCATPDHRTHCHVIASARQIYGHNGVQAQGWRPSEAMPVGLEWLSQIDDKPIPCRFLMKWGFKLHPALQASEAEQIHSAAVRAHCDWCPNFNAGETHGISIQQAHQTDARRALEHQQDGDQHLDRP